MHLRSVLALPQRVITFQIMRVLNILDNFLSDTAQIRTKYHLVNRNQDCSNYAFVDSISFAPVTGVIRFHIMPFVNISNDFFLISHKLDLNIYLTLDIIPTRIV